MYWCAVFRFLNILKKVRQQGNSILFFRLLKVNHGNSIYAKKAYLVYYNKKNANISQYIII